MDKKLSGKNGRSWQDVGQRDVGQRTSWTTAITRRRVLVLVTALLAGAVVRALFTKGRTEAIFIPLFTSTYQAASIPTAPFAEEDAAGIARQFVRVPPVWGHEGHQFLQTLAGLKHYHEDEPVVLYLNAQALRDGAGAIQVLPCDALPDQPETWLPLRSVLTALGACPAHHKLLILDIMRSPPRPRLGVLANDIAAGIDEELKAVPDSCRLVLCACGPGQTPLTSPEMGRSVFGYYLEEGLRGFADSGSRPDRQISVLELAAFVRRRVDRWARLNRGLRQTPVLVGDAADFTLVTLNRQNPPQHLTAAQHQPYPQALTAAWAGRDRWWHNGAYRLAPRAFHAMQALLRAAETDWGAGIDVARIHHRRLSRLEGLQQELAAAEKARVAAPGELPAALQKAYAAELFHRYPDVFPWLKDQLAGAAQARHDAGIRALAEGFVAQAEVEQHTRHAGELDKKLCRAAQTVDQARARLDEARVALALLPPYVNLSTEAQTAWLAAVENARQLAQIVNVQPVTDESRAALEQRTHALTADLATLNRPFLPANLERLQKLASAGGGSEAGPDTVKEIEAILSIPHPLIQAGDRVRLWEAARKIARKLHERTVELDHRQNEQIDGYGEGEIVAGSSPAEQERRRRWTDVLKAEYQKAHTETEQAALQSYKERVAAFRSWLADRYEYQASDFEGLGLNTPAALAARSACRQAAAALERAPASSPLTVHTPVRPGWLSEKHPTTRLVVEARPLASVPGSIGVKIVKPDGLAVRRELLALPVGLGDKSVSDTRLVPLQVRLQPDVGSSVTIQPRGVLLELTAAGRHYHYAVPVPILERGREFRVFLSDAVTGTEPAKSVELQADGKSRRYKLCVDNPTADKVRVCIKMNVGDGFRDVGLSEVGPKTIRPVSCPSLGRRSVQHAVELQLLADSDRATVLDAWSVPVAVKPVRPDGVPSLGPGSIDTLRAGPRVVLPLHPRNVPAGASIEVAMIADGERAWTVLTREPAQKLEVDLHSEDGELAFEAALRQREAAVDLRKNQGRRRLRFRLIDDGDHLLDEAVRDVIVRDPRHAGTGFITGKVVEGPLVQPGLLVILRDYQGNEKARTKTGPDGRYLFDNVSPGRYTVFCSKPASRRQATSPAVTIRPDKEARVNLSLSL